MAKSGENRQPFVGFRLPAKTYAALRDVAEREGRTISGLVRRAVTLYLSAPEKAEAILWSVREKGAKYGKGKKKRRRS